MEEVRPKLVIPPDKMAFISFRIKGSSKNGKISVGFLSLL
jgi:hypothetical protein